MPLRTVSQGPVRVGVVGCGVVADYGHIPAIHRCDLAKLVAFADPDEKRRRTQMDKYGLPGFESFEAMAEAVEMDAVSICTQPDIKLDMVRIAAAHGLHAFCEKPLTDTLEQAEPLVQIMDEAGLMVGVAFVYRGKEVVQRMMELLREGTIGKLRVLRTENLWDYHGIRGRVYPAERRRRALANLGTFDCGVHQLDLLRYMTGGEFADVHAVGTIVEPENEYPDHVIAHGRMDNGVLVYLEESAVYGHTAAEGPRVIHRYHMIGENGVMSCGSTGVGGGATELYVVSGEKQWTETVGGGKAWDGTYRQFYQLILGQPVEHRFVADGHDALANMRMARQIVGQCMAGEEG